MKAVGVVMKIVFLIILISATVFFLFSFILNRLIAHTTNDTINSDFDATALEGVKYQFSVASVINNTTSMQNSPVRPSGELFLDGIEQEISRSNEEDGPENHIMDIRAYAGGMS